MNVKHAAGTGLSLIVAAAFTLLGTPQANAELTTFIWLTNARTPNMEVSIVAISDSLPIWCRVTVRDLDAFGSTRAYAQVFTANTASLTRTFGSFPAGHDVQVDGSCYDRSGDTERFVDVTTMP